jgi:mono/diheme cytochrome c family protein
MFDSFYQFLESLGYPHPIHPTEVHMPIGAVVLAVVLSYCALIFKRPKLYICARHCITIGFIWLFPTILFGFMDWQHFYLGAWLTPIKYKLMLAGVLLVLLGLSVTLGHKLGPDSKAVLSLYTLSFFTVVLLGYFGGNLVFGTRAPAAPAALKSGQEIFHTSCSGCHPGGGNVIVPKLPLITAPQLASFQTFLAWIRDPHMPDGSKGAMPRFSDKQISEKQARELYRYIQEVLVKSK